MYITITAFIFCMGFAVFLGCIFSWIYNYRGLHKEPTGTPRKITDTVPIPLEEISSTDQNQTAIKRYEHEKEYIQSDENRKNAFVRKVLSLFRSRQEKDNNKALSICYWAFNGEGFTLRLADSRRIIGENLFVHKSNKYFSKKEFNWVGTDEAPIDVFDSEEQITRSIAGAAVSGDGKLRGYITIDSAQENAFDDEICMELREIAAFADEVLRTLDLNFKLERENSLCNEMLKNTSVLFGSSSKGNLIANLSEILQDNFRFDRMLIITPLESDKNKWHICETLGEQKEEFKGVSFEVHNRCLLFDLLSGKSSFINETNISIDPYQRRLYEDEPENLELHSLFAVMPPAQNNSYPLAIVIESKENKAVSGIDKALLKNIAAFAALKLSDIQAKDDSKQNKENSFLGIDSNGLGELLAYYKGAFEDLKNSNENLGILFIKCTPSSPENKAGDFEIFLNVLKKVKKAWNGKHLAMLGNGEVILSVGGSFEEEVFNLTAGQIVMNIENFLAADTISVKSSNMWLNREKIEELEKEYEYDCLTVFIFYAMAKFKAMGDTV